MLLTNDPTDLLKTEFQSLPLAEILQKAPSVLLGVSDAAVAALDGLGVKSVFDLALSRVFEAAAQIEDAADNPGNALNRFGAPTNDMVRPGLSGAIKVTDLRFQPVDILAGVSDGAALQAALGVQTIRDLAVFPPFLAAKEILNRVFFPERLIGFDPEAPADLIPKSGEFPTERVQYTTLLLDEIRRPANAPPLIDLAGNDFSPVDVTPAVASDFGFSTLGIGALLTLNQSWFMQGVTLGHLLHSMALAPGESTRIAVVDWSRKSSAGQTEQIGETEALSQDTSRNRSISEVTEAVARESQEGFSRTEAESTTKQAGISGGFIGGAFGIGGSASIGKTNTSAESYATTSGSREVGASMLQQANDRTHQHAHAARTRRASVVREVSQSEHEQVSTRVITNYNHMHALTVQYYEVLQVYRMETAIVRCDRVVFVPFRLIDFANQDMLLRFRAALIDAALTQAIRDALVNFDTLELKPDPNTVFPVLGTSILDSIRGGIVVKPVVAVTGTVLTRSGTPDAAARETGEPGAGEAPTAPERPTRPPVKPPVSTGAMRAELARTLWAAEFSRLGNILGSIQVRRNSESLFVPSDVKIVDGEVRAAPGQALTLTFQRRDGSRFNDPLSASVPLADIAVISITGSNANADVDAGVMLTLSRNNVIFPLELPTVRVVKGSSETKVVAVNAAGADVNLVQHLNDNRLHYSQAVFRALDAATIAGLLSKFSFTMNGQSFPLVQVAEPVPLRIVGNFLAFKINSDPARDLEWRNFMARRGIAIGQAKVDVVPLSSGGIFAEAVLGRFNSAEKIDLTRFWNWQDSPIPIQPSDIAAIQTGTRAQSEDVRPGNLSAPIVNITPPANLPDPTGIAGVLTAIQNGNMFRDLSGLSETVKLAQEALKISGAAATSAGSQATDAFKASLNADVERKKIVADVEKAKLDAAKAKAGKPLADQTATEKGGVINEVNKETAKKGGTSTQVTGTPAPKPGGGSGSGTGAGGGGTTPGSTPGTNAAPDPARNSLTGNVALDRLVNHDPSLRDFIGLDANSPEPTPAVTAEGVPFQEWDFVGGGYGLNIRDTEGSAATFPGEAQIVEIVNLGKWLPTREEDFKSLLLGNRFLRGAEFSDLLLALALSPAGSMKTLNIVAYGTFLSLSFEREFVFTKSTGEITIHDSGIPAGRLANVSIITLRDLTRAGSIASPMGAITLADVRKAFAVDAQVNVFNLQTRLEPDYIQALANLFQAKASGFTQKPVRVTAQVIAETDTGSGPVLSKKIDVANDADPIVQPVDAFIHLLQRDHPARSGIYTAFPRRE